MPPFRPEHGVFAAASSGSEAVIKMKIRKTYLIVRSPVGIS